MKTGYFFITLLCLAFLLAVLTTLGYMVYYRYYLSNRIKRGLRKTGKVKKLTEPFKFFLASMLLISVFLCFFISVENYNPYASDDESTIMLYANNNTATIFSPEKMIPGYTRYEQKCNEYTWVYYINNNNDNGFPYMLIHNNDNQLESISYQFINTDERMNSTIKKKKLNSSEWYVLKSKPSGYFLALYPDGYEDDVIKITCS